MHKRRVNELTLDLIIEPQGPILIKSGKDAGADPGLPAMSFVRTLHPVTGERTIYLPGSSLKGVLRSHSERIIRTVFANDPKACCDPLSKNDSCWARHRDVKETAEQYQSLCLACKIFGHMVNAGHLRTADAYPAQAMDALPVRNGVAIDRLSGGVAVGPFDMEVAVEGKFETRLSLINFELWQVGLLALALRDLAEGRLPLGFAKTRGLGQVQATFGRLEIAYPGTFAAGDIAAVLYGVGALAPDLVDAYGYIKEDQRAYTTPGTLVPESVAWGRPAVRFGHTIDGPLTGLNGEAAQQAHAAIKEVLQVTVAAWAEKAGRHG